MLPATPPAEEARAAKKTAPRKAPAKKTTAGKESAGRERGSDTATPSAKRPEDRSPLTPVSSDCVGRDLSS